MPTLRSGKEENFAYSLSRWTDVVASKWDWLMERLDQGQMLGVDPRTGAPKLWSLAPEDTLGLIWWTREPSNLIKNVGRFLAYKHVINFTLTGWTEVEHKAPDIERGLDLMRQTCDTFGAKNVVWRFSPVPTIQYPFDRWHKIAEEVVKMGVQECYVAFLQENDNLVEGRSMMSRVQLLQVMARDQPNLKVLLCNEDSTLRDLHREHNSFAGQDPTELTSMGAHRLLHLKNIIDAIPDNLSYGICEDSKRFAPDVKTEGCGCALSIDPFSINETCRFGCEYCLDPETPVLFADFGWRPLKDVNVGDTLVGFDETTEGRTKRKYKKSEVEGVYHFQKPCLKITLTDGREVVTSYDHMWLAGTRRRWLKANKLSLSHILWDVGSHMSPVEDTDYKKGYITGISMGDGTCKFPTQGSDHQVYWRLALADVEPLYRVRDYLAYLGLSLELKSFDGGSDLTVKPMQKLETRAKASLSVLENILSYKGTSDSYKRGFLAGAFDAEGSFNKNLRIHQTKNNGYLDRCLGYCQDLGIPVTRESESVRVKGENREKMQFLLTTRPAITRKFEYLYGTTANFDSVRIAKVEDVGVRDVIDIKTSTSTFMAAGLATHNCYAADKSLAPKKRSTTKTTRGRLPVVQ